MNEVRVRSIDYAPLEPAHLGTSKDSQPHQYEELLVAPHSVRGTKDPLMPFKTGGKFYTKLYELEAGTFSAKVSGPRYFAVAFRHGITDISTVNVFCHPNPGYAGMQDNAYDGLQGTWRSLYRYAQHFGVQLAAQKSNMVLVMPMFNNASWINLGVFKTQWHEIIDAILVEVQKVAWPDKAGQTMARNTSALRHVILSDFSAGRTVMTVARGAAGMTAYLREIWDFDGHGGAPPAPPTGGQALVYSQRGDRTGYNYFHVPSPRWKLFPFPPKANVHGEIPMRLFYHAASESDFGH